MARQDNLSSSAINEQTTARLVTRFTERAHKLGITVEAAASLSDVATLVQQVTVTAPSPPGQLVMAPGVAEVYPGLSQQIQARGLAITPVRPDEPATSFPDALRGIGLSTATFGVAETGSLVIADRLADRLVRMLSHTHLVLLERERIIASLDDLAGRLRALVTGGMTLPGTPTPAHALSIITGPSRTADIEMSLTVGAHGPARLIVAILNTQTETGAAR